VARYSVGGERQAEVVADLSLDKEMLQDVIRLDAGGQLSLPGSTGAIMVGRAQERPLKLTVVQRNRADQVTRPGYAASLVRLLVCVPGEHPTPRAFSTASLLSWPRHKRSPSNSPP
jgi:hypothetical protein